MPISSFPTLYVVITPFVSLAAVCVRYETQIKHILQQNLNLQHEVDHLRSFAKTEDSAFQRLRGRTLERTFGTYASLPKLPSADQSNGSTVGSTLSNKSVGTVVFAQLRNGTLSPISSSGIASGSSFPSQQSHTLSHDASNGSNFSVRMIPEMISKSITRSTSNESDSDCPKLERNNSNAWDRWRERGMLKMQSIRTAQLKMKSEPGRTNMYIQSHNTKSQSPVQSVWRSLYMFVLKLMSSSLQLYQALFRNSSFGGIPSPMLHKKHIVIYCDVYFNPIFKVIKKSTLKY